LHVEYLQAITQSQRSREACLKYLQRNLINFYPERMDLVRCCDELAVALGGRLKPSTPSRKYAWLAPVIGPAHLKTTQIAYNRLKSALVRAWDKALSKIESPRPL